MEKEIAERRLHELNSRTLTDDENYERFLLEESIEKMNSIIKKEETKEEEITNYFVKTGSLLFKHCRNGDYSHGGVSLVEDAPKKQPVSIADLFKSAAIDHTPSNNEAITSKYLQLVGCNDNVVIADVSANCQANSPALSQVEKEYEMHEMCSSCNVEKVLNRVEAAMICPSCSKLEYVLIDSNKPHYKDPPRDFASYSYKRINHFNEWLAQFQAKESTDIPEEVYNKILLELKKERTSNMAKLTPTKIKTILKRLGYSKYYEHVPHIIYHITGRPAPVMTRATEEKLRQMFKEIQAPFLMFCPENRKNFLSYSYVLHKLCQLLGLDEFLPCFLLLKSREKLHQQDKIWASICAHLQWQFIKSV